MSVRADSVPLVPDERQASILAEEAVFPKRRPVLKTDDDKNEDEIEADATKEQRFSRFCRRRSKARLPKKIALKWYLAG